MNSEKTLTTFVNWFANRPRISGCIISIVLSLLVIILSLERFNVEKEQKRSEMNTILDGLHENIEQSLRNCQVSIVSLALTIDDNGTPQNFNEVAKQLIDSNPVISLVQLVPNGIIKYIYPIKGNEAAINLYILKPSEINKKVLKSIQNKTIYFDGPLQLTQGGIGIVGRLPIYKKNKFWGFSAAVIKLDNLLKISKFNSIDSFEYDFQFSNLNPFSNKEEFYFSKKIDLTKKNYVYKNIPSTNWKIYLIEKNTPFSFILILLRGILGILIAISFGFFTNKLLKNPEKLKILLNEQKKDLLKNEMKFKRIFDQATMGFAFIDAQTDNFIEINEKYCSILGYTIEEIKNKNFLSFTHNDGLDDCQLNLSEIKKGNIREYSSEKKYITKSGHIIWVNLTISPLWEIDEEPTVLIAFIKDITARKEANSLIEKSEKRFKSIFENSPLPLWEEDFSAVKKRLVELNLVDKDPKTVYTYFDENPNEVLNCISLVKVIDVNNECLKLHKVKDKKLFLKDLVNFIDEESTNTVKLQLVAITQNQQSFSDDSRIKTLDGNYRDINLQWSVINGFNDPYRRVIVSTQDITDRKAAEDTIKNAQQRTESIINAIDGIVWEYDLKTMSSSFISRKVEKILGYTVEDYMKNGTFWEDHIHPEDRESALKSSSIENKSFKDHDYEYRMITKNGKTIWIKDIVNIVYENEIPVIARGIMIDITLMKEAQKDLKNSFDLVTEQNKRLLNFSYIVSHNLRSHTSNIDSILSLIEAAESDEERNEMLALLKSVSSSLDETMIHLNEVVNINTNIDLVVKPLDINKFISKAQEVLSEQIKLNKATIITDIPEDPIIDYNSAYLESILYNLISNGIRYRHPERKPIITIKLHKENEENVIEVTDNGIGIDLEKNGNKLFGMYKTFSNNPDARGIGLFITKNQIEAMGGRITVESELNIGTTFKIYTK